MLKIFRSLFPNFDNMERTLIVTHADIDHCGLHDLFDTFYVNEETRLNFALQNNGLPDLREQNRICAPYNRICKLMTGYTPPDMHSCALLSTQSLQATHPSPRAARWSLRVLPCVFSTATAGTLRARSCLWMTRTALFSAATSW